MTGIRVMRAANCLGRTCMKWGADGDLTALDLALVLDRLAQVDQEVASLQRTMPVEAPVCPPMPSFSPDSRAGSEPLSSP